MFALYGYRFYTLENKEYGEIIAYFSTRTSANKYLKMATLKTTIRPTKHHRGVFHKQSLLACYDRAEVCKIPDHWIHPINPPVSW